MAPNPARNAFFFTLSTSVDIRGSWTKEILAYAKKYCLWYAIKHETDLQGVVHIHFAGVVEHVDANTPKIKGMGPQNAGNRKDHIIRHCHAVRDYLIRYPSKHAAHCCDLTDSRFLEYMNKQNSLVYHDLPLDIVEIIPYFAPQQVKSKPSNDLEAWKNDFHKRHPNLAKADVTWDHVKDYSFNAQYVWNTMRVYPPEKEFSKVKALIQYITGVPYTAPIQPPAKKRCVDCVSYLGRVNAPIYKNAAGGNDPNWGKTFAPQYE